MKKLKDKKLRILITGGAGFIGSHLVDFCLRHGAEVGILIYHKKATNRFSSRKEPSLFFGSIVNKKAVQTTIRKFHPEMVFHCAALSDRTRSFKLFQKFYETNVQGTKNLLDALLDEKQLKSFIAFGSMEEYGGNKAPFYENDREQPVSPYSLTKTIANHLILYYARHLGLPATIVRPPVVYGPRQIPSMFIPSLIEACLTKKDFPMTRGEQTRDFLYVGDLASAVWKIAHTPRTIGEIFNIGSGKEKSVKEVANFINALFGNPIKLRFGTIPYRKEENFHMYFNTEKARNVLGWKPQVNLRNGLLKIITSIKDQAGV